MKNHYFGTMMVTVQGVSLLIMDLKSFEVLERVQKHIALGGNIYHQQPVAVEDVQQVTQHIQGFVQLLKDYQISDYELLGSEALSQAMNADFIADQVVIQTGLKITWLTVNEETYYQNQALLAQLTRDSADHQITDVHFINIKSGSTTITRFRNKQFVFSTHFPLGPVKIAEDLENLRQSVPNSVEVLNDYIDSKLADFERSLPADKGTEINDAVLVGTLPFNHSKTGPSRTVSMPEFEHLFEEMIDASDQYISEQLAVPEAEIPLVLPELLLSRKILQLTHAKRVIFSDTSIIDGFAIAQSNQRGFHKQHFEQQLLTASESLADHYRVEPVHRKLVTKFALHLFDQLKPLHALDQHARILLEVAANLHDVGTYINIHEHYVHSDYIIRHSDIIGLSASESNVIAAVTRYHSVQTPTEELNRFGQFAMPDRLLIAKLAAILRLADALDDDRKQKIQKISVSLKDDQVVVTAVSNSDLALENWVFAFKSRFFEETFGLPVQLKQRRSAK